MKFEAFDIDIPKPKPIEIAQISKLQSAQKDELNPPKVPTNSAPKSEIKTERQIKPSQLEGINIGPNNLNKTGNGNPINKNAPPTGPVESGSFNNPQQGNALNAATQKTMHDLECLKLDEKERPKDCPPNSNARRAIEAHNAPKYNPALMGGLSRAEYKAKYYAGWREPCQMENGGRYQYCFPIGKKPARVKTPYELCMEKGLGGCERASMPDGSKSPALNYGN